MSQQGDHTVNAETDASGAIHSNGTGAIARKPKKASKPDPVATAAADQKAVRSQITTTAKTICSLMADLKSRTSIKSLLAGLLRLKQEAITLNDFLVKVKAIDTKKMEKQQASHLKYEILIADLEEKVENHLASRADEATTVAPSVTSKKKVATKAPSLPKSKRAAASQTLKPSTSKISNLLDQLNLQPEARAVANALLIRKPSSFASAHSNFLNERQPIANEENDEDEMGEEEEDSEEEELGEEEEDDDHVELDDEDPNAAALNEALLICQRDDGDLPVAPRQNTRKRVTDWIAAQEPPTTEDPAPDDWIDTYVNGSSTPIVPKRNKDDSSLRARLDIFTGQSLEWFMWISKFHSLVHLTNKTPDEKLAVLHSYLSEGARRRINGLAGGELAYKQALRRLKQAFGDRDVMVCAIKTALSELKVPANNPTGLQEYADNARSLLFDLSRVGGTGSNEVIDSIANQLVLEDRRAWNTEKRTLILLGSHPLNVFGEWLCDRAKDYQTAESIAAAQRASIQGTATHNAPARNQSQQRHQNQQHRPSGNRHVRVHHGSTQGESSQSGSTQGGPPPRSSTVPPTQKKLYCFQCSEQHRLAECKLFKEKPVIERLAFATQHRLCRCCLGIRHRAKDCRFKKECGVTGCKELHHPLLHGPTTLTDSSTYVIQSNSATTESTGSKVALGTICVEIQTQNGKTVEANLLHDTASTGTLFREGLVNQLKLFGPSEVLAVDAVGGERSKYKSQRIQLKLRGPNGKHHIVQGSSIPVVANPVPVVDWTRLKNNWSHLADLPLKPSGGQVDILLGSDYAHLLAVTECRLGKEFEPVGSLTQLGWMVNGVIGADAPVTSIRVHHAAFSRPDEYSELTEQFRKFCDTDNFGSEHKTDGLSTKDKELIQSTQANTKKLERGYEVPILWKKGEPKPPNNLPMAESRNRGLIARFKKEPEYERKCRAALEKNFTEGYAVRLPPDSVNNNPAYYLPVFGTTKKWNDKIRIVFDAAARFHGRCLNDCVDSGPVLQNPLPLVITRFRWSEIAFAADIQAMFSRIRLMEEDRPYHRFLWPDENGVTHICEMTRVTFGVSCSPFLAILTTWRAAQDAGPENKEAADQIKQNLYIDDYLSSAQTETEAIRIATLVKAVLSRGDFNLVGWMSNSTVVTEALQPDAVTPVISKQDDRPIGSESTEMVLGMSWRPSNDTLGFRPAALDAIDNTEFTRIGLVSCVARIYDPLGLASPLTVKAKIRNRQLAQRGLHWQDPIDQEERSWWEQWIQLVKQLHSFQISRCIFARLSDISQVELHTFGDASEEAFAAVSYLRVVYRDQSIAVHLLKGNTVLSKLKTVSIPKLELDAAVLAVRQARFIQEGLGGRVTTRFFWTDSSTVRNWIRATAGHYQIYVSNRIGEVQTLSKPEEWRFIPGKLNPADAATRSKLEDEAIPELWRKGAALLYVHQQDWPADLPWMAVTAEIRAVRVHHAAVEKTFDWEKVPVSASTVPALIGLEEPYATLVKRCQEESFPAELERLEKGKPVRHDSKLLTLNPMLDKSGIIRLGGRLGKTQLPYDQKHPPVLPGRHPFVKLIIKAFHHQLLHVGTEFLLTQIRQHFWLLNGREAVKQVRRNCMQCKQQQAKPEGQLMADLHPSRLAEGEPPFARTAVDYFGPMEVGYARNRKKKMWGALFTCLTTRSVYLDLAPSLNSTDFLLILRRFISFYGRPKRVHSDNGTNFVGAERILREAVLQLHEDSALKLFLQSQAIVWTFQPARTPHFGGAHESLVKSTKKALYFALDQEEKSVHLVPEDVLRTLLYEVAGLLNSRPLTCAGIDPDDLRPLTPNDFLNRPSAFTPPVLDAEDPSPQDRYRQVKRTTALFWSHWRGSYLQSIAVHPKWNIARRNLEVGDVVMEKDGGFGKGRWSVGRVIKVYPGADNLVRDVDIELENGVFNRGIHQLCLLQRNSAASSVPHASTSGENGAASKLSTSTN